MIPGLDACPSLQGKVRWPEVYASGRRFVFVKASQGLTVAEDIGPYVGGARAAGLLVGAYHFAEVHQDPVKQIDHFFAASGGLGMHAGELPPVIDVESPGNRPNETLLAAWARHGLDPAGVRRWIETAARRVVELWGRPPIIYWNRSWAIACESEKLAIDVLACLLWEAEWWGPGDAGPGLTKRKDWTPTGQPKPLRPWTRTRFWQDGRLDEPGADVITDQDWFLGTEEELRELARVPAPEPDVILVPMPVDVGAVVLQTQSERDSRDADE